MLCKVRQLSNSHFIAKVILVFHLSLKTVGLSCRGKHAQIFSCHVNLRTGGRLPAVTHLQVNKIKGPDCGL